MPSPSRLVVKSGSKIRSALAGSESAYRQLAGLAKDARRLPVVDEDQRMVGLITVDDVLEQMLPSGWRRRYGLARR